MFTSTSRYSGLPVATHRLPDGRTVTYVRRRFVPKPEDLTPLGVHVVLPGERLDRIAFVELGAAELAWRIADANRALDPDELAVAGRRLRITLPAGAGAWAGMSLASMAVPGAAHG